jgi:lipopolysaccharide biosynthesis glycosyltransferase
LIIFNPNNCNNNIIDRFKIFDKTHEQFCPYFEDCCFGDQCIFNLVFTDDWTELPLDLNVQSAAWRHPEWYTAKIRHYTGGEKFLPVIYWRSDLSERRLMQRIAGLLDDKSLRYPLWAGLAAQFTFYRQARMRKCHRPKLDRLKTFIARHNAGAGLAG